MGNIFKILISAFCGMGAGLVFTGHFMLKDMKKKGELAEKQSLTTQMLNQWLCIKQEGKSISDYLYEKGYREVAVYGMNFLGERLVSELQGTEVTVRYVIDKKVMNISKDITCCSPDKPLEKVDAVIVSVNYLFDEIYQELSQKIEFPIMNLEDILYDV